MPTPTWATDRVSAEVEGFVRHRASVSANEIANELKIGHQFAVSALKELQNRGVVGRSDAEGQCHVLRRGDISILTRRKTEELLRLMKHSRYETTLRPDRS
jgi:predicted ArsR family transcriptional regulator